MKNLLKLRKRAKKTKKWTRQKASNADIDAAIKDAVAARVAEAVATARSEERIHFLQIVASARSHWNAPLGAIEDAVRSIDNPPLWKPVVVRAPGKTPDKTP
jgi:hypothetical protein